VHLVEFDLDFSLLIALLSIIRVGVVKKLSSEKEEENGDYVPSTVTKNSTIVLGENSYQKKDYDLLVKILLLGDSGVGKSAIMLRFTEDRFTEDLMSTIGLDFKMKMIEIDNKTVNIQIWDTAGQEKFKTITKTYYRGASGYIIVYDVTNRNSFDHVSTWVDEINDHGNNDMIKILVGNKCDLDGRTVTIEEGKELARKLDMPFFEASALTGANVTQIFHESVKSYLQSPVDY